MRIRTSRAEAGLKYSSFNIALVPAICLSRFWQSARLSSRPEKGSTIGFAGKRVIQDTIREELPIDFQKAEYLHEHGMVDIVVHRKELKNTLSDILHHIT